MAAMSSKTKTVMVIAGPTAVGKTALSIQLAQHFDTAIISADSRQCYKEMSIGTAKPTSQELAKVPHYFIDSFSVTKPITAAGFEQLALGYLEEIFSTNNYAVVCGGTGLYIKALCEGLDEMPPVDKIIETEILKSYHQYGLEWLQEKIKETDTLFYQSGEIQNPARVLRALIFKLSTGKSILDFQSGKKKKRDFHIIKIALDLPRPLLYERINHRVDRMMEEGLLDEVKQLQPYQHLKNLQTVGYQELFNYLNHKYSLEDAVEKIKQHTRNYAKRQWTWFRKDKDFIWLDAREENLVGEVLRILK